MYDTHFPWKLWRKASMNYILIIYKIFLCISTVIVITYILHSTKWWRRCFLWWWWWCWLLLLLLFQHTNKFLTKFVGTFRIYLFIKWKALLRLERVPTDNGNAGASPPASLAPAAFSFGLPHPAKVLITNDSKKVKWLLYVIT